MARERPGPGCDARAARASPPRFPAPGRPSRPRRARRRRRGRPRARRRPRETGGRGVRGRSAEDTRAASSRRKPVPGILVGARHPLKRIDPDRRQEGLTRRSTQLVAVAFALALSLAVVVLGRGAAAAALPGGWEQVGSNTAAPKQPALNGIVNALNTDRPGVMYVGGNFTDAGGDPNADYIAQVGRHDLEGARRLAPERTGDLDRLQERQGVRRRHVHRRRRGRERSVPPRTPMPSTPSSSRSSRSRTRSAAPPEPARLSLLLLLVAANQRMVQLVERESPQTASMRATTARSA